MQEKSNLIDFGFRLPSALDNRPLKFNEFDKIIPKIPYTFLLLHLNMKLKHKSKQLS